MSEERVKVRALREDLSEVINRVRYQQATVVVTCHGRPVVAMISVDELKRLRANAYTPREDAQIASV